LVLLCPGWCMLSYHHVVYAGAQGGGGLATAAVPGPASEFGHLGGCLLVVEQLPVSCCLCLPLGQLGLGRSQLGDNLRGQQAVTLVASQLCLQLLDAVLVMPHDSRRKRWWFGVRRTVQEGFLLGRGRRKQA
jgi:hypothetical protein